MNINKYKKWVELISDSYDGSDKDYPPEIRPLTEEAYLKNYNLGTKAFEKNKSANGRTPPKKIQEDLFYSAYPWYDGFDEAAVEYFDKTFNIVSLQEEIKKLILSRGLVLKFEDEYGYPYIELPGNFTTYLCTKDTK